jgi:two-component system, OmpR family, response regulator RegX3
LLNAALRLALLEDDSSQAQVLKHWVVGAGHVCHVFATGKPLIGQLSRESYDMLLLDWEVPGMDGPAVLNWVRQRFAQHLPVIFVTARVTEQDIVHALSLGADDYVIKPVRERELIARIHALWRRTRPLAAAREVLEFPPYRLDAAAHCAMFNGQPLELTQKEFDLALFLFRNVGQLLSRGHILESVWGRNPEVLTRTMDTHVSKVRAKLKVYPENGFRLTPVYGYGYRLEQVGDAAAAA